MDTILITGATDGLGRALAQKYAATGKRLLLVGRRPLHSLSNELFTPRTYCQADLARPDAPARVAAWLATEGIERLDCLVHNAGTGFYGPLPSQSAEEIDTVLRVNLQAPIELTHRLTHLLPQNGGQVAFISSAATAVPTPAYAVYGASKSALEGFARSLRVEWEGRATVQIIRPGATRTGMHAKIGLTRAEMDWEKFPPAEKVAGQLQRALEGRRREATLGVNNRLLRFAGLHGRLLLDPLLKKKSPALTLSADRSAAEQPLCVITGAADGIGRALALRYARAGYRILGADIDAERAAATAAALTGLGADNRFVIADLRQEAGRRQLLAAVRSSGPVSTFVHNAGINAVGPFTSIPINDQEEVLALNLHAPLQITARLFSQNLLRPAANFIFLSSLSYFLSYPGAAVYAASKEGLANYARSLRAAWPGTVLTVFPGPTRTAHARRYSPDNSREERRMAPEKVAEAIFSAAHRKQTRLIPGLANRMMAFGGTIAPRLLEWGMKQMILAKMAAD